MAEDSFVTPLSSQRAVPRRRLFDSIKSEVESDDDVSTQSCSGSRSSPRTPDSDGLLESHCTAPRRRLFDSLKREFESDDNQSSSGCRSSPRTPVMTPRSPPDSDGLLDSPVTSHPIYIAFVKLQELRFGKSSPPVSLTEILYKPETQFDKIIIKLKEYMAEVNGAIVRSRALSELKEEEIADAETDIEKGIAETSTIAKHLQRYLEEASIRRSNDNTVNPRIIVDLKGNEASLMELNKIIREAKKDLQRAMNARQRADLFNEWGPFDRSSRGRDHEEMMADSTERLMNSKRILLETIQASSDTLGSLATSSQSIQKNDEELSTQQTMVSSARGLLKKYGRRASTDKISIWLGFIFFGFCAMIVAYRRLF